MIIQGDDIKNILDPHKHCKDLRYFFRDDLKPSPFASPGTTYSYFCEIQDDVLVGVIKLKTGGYKDIGADIHDLVVYMTTHTDYKHQGICRRLLVELFQYMQENEYSVIKFSGYSEEGYKLRKYIHSLGKEYGIKIIDRDKVEYL